MITSGGENDDVQLKNNILYIILRNSQTLDEQNVLLDKVIEATRANRLTNGMIIDLTDIKTRSLSRSIRNQIKLIISETSVKNIAFVSSSYLHALLLILKNRYYGKDVSFFRNNKKAKEWIQLRKNAYKRNVVALIIGIIIILMGVLVIIGWFLKNTLLVSFLPNQLPVNPLAAICLIMAGVTFIAYSSQCMPAVYLASIFIVLVNIVNMIDVDTGTIFFTNLIQSYGPKIMVSHMSSLIFIAAGFIGLLSNRDTKHRKFVDVAVKYVLTIVILIISIANIYGFLYFRNEISQIGSQAVIPLGLAIGFTIIATGIIFMKQNRHTHSAFSSGIPLTGWAMIILIVIVQTAGFGFWSQMEAYNANIAKQNFQFANNNLSKTLSSQIKSYQDIAISLKSLYAASDDVSRNDFLQYLEASNLKNYPGLRVVAYNVGVPEDKIQQFISYESKKGDPSFIVLNNNAKVRYIGAYVYDTSEKNDLSIWLNFDSTGLANEYNNTQKTSDIYSSGTVQFPTKTNNEDKGFFIAVPVNDKALPNFTIFISMGIVYKPFFKQVFADSTIENNLSVKVIDKKTNTVIYNSLNIVPGDQIIKSTSSLSIANREWLIESSAPIGYGLNNGENMQPWLIILMAQLLSILLVIIFIWQNGQRKHASNLVAIATKGLEIEQKRVLEMNQKDEAVLNSAGEGIISFDIHGKIIIANESALRLLGISKKDEVVGQSLGKVIKAYTIAGKSIPQSQRLFSKALRSSEIERITMIYKRKDGTTFPVRVTVAPVIMDNKSIGAVDIFSDITSEVQLNKAKDEFLSLASHQLRTPLTAIKWYIEAILDKNVSGRLNEKQSGIIEKIDLSNQRMIKLVTSLLDVSRIESGRLIIQIKPTNYKELILSVLQESSQNIKEKHQNIIFNYDKKLTDINLDDNLIRQVVSNLVVNANRYSPDGTTIEIAVEVKGDTVLTTIKDQGYGIPEKQQSSIFNKFFRADNAISKDPNGNGLGLYLVKSIIKESGGHIWFTSELDKGSTFYFVLPLKGVRNRKGDVSLE